MLISFALLLPEGEDFSICLSLFFVFLAWRVAIMLNFFLLDLIERTSTIIDECLQTHSCSGSWWSKFFKAVAKVEPIGPLLWGLKYRGRGRFESGYEWMQSCDRKQICCIWTHPKERKGTTNPAQAVRLWKWGTSFSHTAPVDDTKFCMSGLGCESPAK